MNVRCTVEASFPRTDSEQASVWKRGAGQDSASTGVRFAALLREDADDEPAEWWRRRGGRNSTFKYGNFLQSFSLLRPMEAGSQR